MHAVMRVVTLRPPPIAASCWALVMHMRGVAHPLPEEWYADDADEPTALVHREPLPLAGRESEDGIRIQLGSWGEPERAVRVAAEAVDSAASMAQGRVMFAALDRALLPPLTSALAELPLPRVPTWQSKCGLYRPSATAAAARELELPSGVALRPLRGSDARLVDSRWTYRSARSAAMVSARSPPPAASAASASPTRAAPASCGAGSCATRTGRSGCSGWKRPTADGATPPR